jgi:hypothetical protein
MMTTMTTTRTLAIASIFLALAAPAFSATPAPKATSQPKAIPLPKAPPIALDTAFIVEVNAKGQVVRVEKAISKNQDLQFNAQTYGNVLQMWIRHPDGTAETGLYRVSYHYDPKTQKVSRSIELLKDGGSWANAEGAANRMMDIATREAKAAHEKQQGQQQQQNEHLPSLEQIIGPSASPKPSPHP